MRALVILLFALGAATPAHAAEAAAVRRLALLVGVNDGGPERVRLRYAETDAKAFSTVLSELGGVLPQDRVLLTDVDRAGVLAGFDRVRRLAEGVRTAGARRVEVLLYYSGHSDDEGLLLKGQRLDYGELRRSLEGLPADVRIAVLDSCASGAFARKKGGVSRPAFLVDSAIQVKGHAILTSSSADEASQESDRLGGSFFTHHLLSGLRGAADVTHDGRVTLTEAYQFAFHETLARTERTQGGAQHPNYDIELAGTGDLVMTDLRATTAGLVLTEPLEGRLYVRDAVGTLVVEVQKQSGRATELGLAPGAYRARREWDGGVSEAAFTLKEGARTPLSPGDFLGVGHEATVMRGGGGGMSLSPQGRVQLPVNLSLVPSMSTNTLRAGRAQVENRFALGIVNGGAALGGGLALGLAGNVYDAEVSGLALALGFNTSGREVSGAQLSLVTNVAGGSVVGAQASLGLNVANGDVDGIGQLALGANVARGALGGVQAALGANVTTSDATGIQLSLGANHANGTLKGVQFTLGVNSVATAARGIQGSVLLNHAPSLTGMQLGLINVGGDVSGMQLGLINVADTVHGMQLGLVNVSDEVNGVPVGLVSYEKKGQLHLEVFGSDVQLTNLALKFGGKYFYTTLLAGIGPDDRFQRFSLGLGLGGHIPLGSRFWVDVDVAASQVLSTRDPFSSASNNMLTQARAMLGFQVMPRLAVFAGPTYNVAFTWGEPEFAKLTTLPVRSHVINADTRMQRWPGFQVGVRL
ncbi:caspase family protein [Corallococcus sp. AB011P]|uniref:caspase family protein n=1 Tax=unclassified Corallococcus TaxID=2685029 RepID=UPI000EA049A4|nr:MULTISPECIES: caspase family protein [unclassified Corallococcus]RKG56185.1 caspase family protein [Corallococcus sp. AB011P]RKH85862.1 caspase family protein [Corallococcus sp. AB045]